MCGKHVSRARLTVATSLAACTSKSSKQLPRGTKTGTFANPHFPQGSSVGYTTHGDATRRQNSDPGWVGGLGARIRVIRVGLGLRDSRWVTRVESGWVGSGRVGSGWVGFQRPFPPPLFKKTPRCSRARGALIRNKCPGE